MYAVVAEVKYGKQKTLAWWGAFPDKAEAERVAEAVHGKVVIWE